MDTKKFEKELERLQSGELPTTICKQLSEYARDSSYELFAYLKALEDGYRKLYKKYEFAKALLERKENNG